MYQEIKLISKRNQVYRIYDNDNTYISKTFMDSGNILKEIEILKLLKDKSIKVPNILDIKDNTLILEDLGEITLLDWFEQMEKTNSTDYSEIIYKLSLWLKKFYSATKEYYNIQMILYDVNLRNFIIKDNEIYGIDFEQTQPGQIEEDIGKMVAYCLTYNPDFTEWKKVFIEELMDTMSDKLGIEKKIIIVKKDKEIDLICKRRKK